MYRQVPVFQINFQKVLFQHIQCCWLIQVVFIQQWAVWIYIIW